MNIISGTEVRKKLLEDYKEKIKKDNLKISLVIIQIGDNEASNTYIRNKLKYTKEVGIKSKLMKLDESITEEELIERN